MNLPATSRCHHLRASRWFLLSVVVASCSGSNAGEEPALPSGDGRRNVMVIDQGIDVQATDFEGKVVAAFTLDCPPATQPADPYVDGATTFDDLKERYIAQLMIPDAACVVTAGISAKADPLANVSRFREQWNQALRGQLNATDVFSPADWAELEPALDGELQSFSYHGTATAGIIAHDNPDVRLILVERQLDAKTATEQSFTCILQTELDTTVALLSDPEVRDAYAHAPPTAFHDELQKLSAAYSVGVVNMSFGRPPRVTLEELQAGKQCPAVELKPYFDTRNAVERARGTFAGGLPALTTRSAGNDSAQIDSAADALGCPADPFSVLVGSYGPTQEQSFFSNFGACVDVSAPGENIIVPYAGGWLMTASGTSFSSALVARLVSLTAPVPFEASDARQALLMQRGPDNHLPPTAFPGSLVFAPTRGLSRTQGALSAAMTNHARADTPHRQAQGNELDLSELLAPLMCLRRTRP